MSGSFVEMSAAEQASAARQYLASKGLPVTTANLNRAMSALISGSEMPAESTADRVDRSIARTQRRPTQPRANAAQPPAQQQASAQNTPPAEVVGGGDAMPGEEVYRTPQNEPRTRGAQVAAANTTSNPNAAMPGGRRGGTINGATVIDENDPTAGMFEGQPPRQADETGVDPVMLAMALGIPIAGAGAMAAMAPRIAGAVAPSAAPNVAMQQYQRQRLLDLLRTNPPRGGAAPSPGVPISPAPNAPVAMPPNAGVGGQGSLLTNPARPIPMSAPQGPQIGLPPGQSMVAGPPPPMAANPAQEALAAARGMAGRPATSFPRQTGPARGQQALPDNAPVRQPNVQNTRRNPHVNLQTQQARNRLVESLRNGR